MKKRVFSAALALLVAAGCLGGCAAKPDASSPQPQSSAPASSSSSPAPSSSQPQKQQLEVSYDVNAWTWQQQSFSGYTMILPVGVYIEGDKIYEESAVLPESLFKLNNFPGIVAWVRPGSLAGSDITYVDDETYYFTPYEGQPRNLTLSDDETLPESTFYIFGDYLAYTFVGGVGGDGTRATMLKQTAYVPLRGDGVVVTFYAEADSTDGKPLYERIIGSIEKGAAEVTPPPQSTGPRPHTVAADGGLNLRAGPGTQYESLMLIPQGAEVTETGAADSGPWLYVLYNGAEGWVSGEYLEPKDG